MGEIMPEITDNFLPEAPVPGRRRRVRHPESCSTYLRSVGGAAVAGTGAHSVLGVLNVLRAPLGRVINPLGRRLAAAGVTPDFITVLGTVGATASALVFFSRGSFFTGTMFVWAFVMLDMVDGAVARAGGLSSRFGAVLDSSCDRVADAAVFGGLAWWFARHDHPTGLAASLLCLVLGSLTSYIKARAEGMGMTANVGIAERSERLVVILIGTGLTGWPVGVPHAVEVALWILVAASTITVGQRLATVWRQAQSPAALQ